MLPGLVLSLLLVFKNLFANGLGMVPVRIESIALFPEGWIGICLMN